MAGPHPLVAAARNALRAEFSAFAIGAPVVLAVSGGADSMALAASAQYAARENLLQLHSVVVDHGIRSESAQEAAEVQQRLTQMGIRAQVISLSQLDPALGAASLPTLQTETAQYREGPEGAARRGRYQALAQVARELGARSGNTRPAVVLLGHNRNDQAESVLLGLGRGSGGRSIAGMPRAGALPIFPDVPMLRPLLDFTHSQLQTICQELAITYVEDPSNHLDGPWRTAAGDPLRRARIRHEVIPLLEDVLAEGVVEALGRTARILQDDGAALDAYAQQAWAQTVETEDRMQQSPSVPEKRMIQISCLKLENYPRAIRTRVLRTAFLASGGRGGELVFWHLDRLDRLVRNRQNNLKIDLPGVCAVKNQHILKFIPRS
ncbi:tRNA lysidine(34) synthetase TilS [Arcanobacterium hippocoleae]|uniref:tRNA lysidine(34) synthetase TilS n=1 Tax=Arcanobacterium hippocoleae TaxID=149017 RepID=UPI00333FDFBA